MRCLRLLALAAALPAGLAATGHGPLLGASRRLEERHTLNGCACQMSWDSGIQGQPPCSTGCCNPDNDPTGDWCKVQDSDCEGETWGYCAQAGTVPSRTCWDSPITWRDNEADGCSDYVQNKWCTADGHVGASWAADWGSFMDYASEGVTATVACCGCGGGTSTQPTGASGPQSGCHDHPPGWGDSEGDTCESYASGLWCTAEGAVGQGWDGAWGAITDFKSQERSAFEACCTCGGGSSVQVADGCKDRPDWADRDGDHCASYGLYDWCSPSGGYGSGWRSVWGEFPPGAGEGAVSAVVACCACGGGSTAANGGQGGGPPPAPVATTPRPTFAPVPEGVRQTWNGCACKKEWQDSRGSSCTNFCCNPDSDASGEWCLVEDEKCEEMDWGYCTPERSGAGSCINDPVDWKDSEDDDCYHYTAGQWCTATGQPGAGWVAAWGSFGDYANNGSAATKACCGCGGGKSAAGGNTLVGPTGDACRDLPSWQDSEGDNCLAYAAGTWCTASGAAGATWDAAWGTIEDYAGSDGNTAFQACCACGGGTAGSHSQVFGSCQDTAGWKDRDGDACADYLTYGWCKSDGSAGIGWHKEWGDFPPAADSDKTAAKACCACGGGSGPPRTASLQLAGVLANDKDDGRVHSYGHASESSAGTSMVAIVSLALSLGCCAGFVCWKRQKAEAAKAGNSPQMPGGGGFGGGFGARRCGNLDDD